MRIWDQFAGSSCSLELHKLTVGTLVAVAVYPAEQRLTELWPFIGISPARRDHVLGTCCDPIRIFTDNATLRQYVDSAHWRRPK